MDPDLAVFKRLGIFALVFLVGVGGIITWRLHSNIRYAEQKALQYHQWSQDASPKRRYLEQELQNEIMKLQALREKNRLSSKEYEERISLLRVVFEVKMKEDDAQIALFWEELSHFFRKKH